MKLFIMGLTIIGIIYGVCLIPTIYFFFMNWVNGYKEPPGAPKNPVIRFLDYWRIMPGFLLHWFIHSLKGD